MDKISQHTQGFLQQALDQARQGLAEGNAPFGAVLVDSLGQILKKSYGQTKTLGPTYHPEFILARWAAAHLSLEQRQKAHIYTTAEHCTMCAAASGLAQLGHITFIASAKQLADWSRAWGGIAKPIRSFRINQIAPKIVVAGPVQGLLGEYRQLQRKFYLG